MTTMMTTTRMSRNLYLVTCVFIIACIGPRFGFGKEIKKRQIYREQVLPHQGGKIPETAFQTDRLALNRLQKEGIAVPDGVLLEQRNPQVYPFSHKSTRPVLKVEAASDQRYTPPEGQYFHLNGGPSVDTTYPVPQIANINIYPQHHLQQQQPPHAVHLPLHRPLLLPNPLLEQNPFPLQSHHYQSFNGKVIIGPPAIPLATHTHQIIGGYGRPSSHNTNYRFTQQYGSPFFKWNVFHNDAIFNDLDSLLSAVSNHLR